MSFVDASRNRAMILAQTKDFFNFKAFIIAAGTLGSLALIGVIVAWVKILNMLK